jgi:hypothetical protein
VGVHGESRDYFTMVHAKTILPGKVASNIPACEWQSYTLIIIPIWEIVLMVSTKQKWVFHFPLESNFLDFLDFHGCNLL